MSTPHPWKWVGGEGSELDYLVGPDEREIMNFGDCEMYYPTAGVIPCDSDKALIAAAPELLVSLKALVEWLGYHGGQDMEDAERAITKAEGGST